MIPESEYRTDPESGVRYVMFPDVALHHGDEARLRFGKWMFGQTGILLPNGTMGIYVHDYERWVGREKEHGEA